MSASPAPAPEFLALFKLAVVAHAPISAPAPVHSSVTPVELGSKPPKASDEVLLAPALPNCDLAVLKLVVSLQLVPSHSSVNAYKPPGDCVPAKPKPEVVVPDPAKSNLA